MHAKFLTVDLGEMLCGATECDSRQRYEVTLANSPMQPVRVCYQHRRWAERWLVDREKERRQRMNLCERCGLDQYGSVDSCDCLPVMEAS